MNAKEIHVLAIHQPVDAVKAATQSHVEALIRLTTANRQYDLAVSEANAASAAWARAHKEWQAARAEAQKTGAAIKKAALAKKA